MKHRTTDRSAGILAAIDYLNTSTKCHTRPVVMLLAHLTRMPREVMVRMCRTPFGTLPPLDITRQ